MLRRGCRRPPFSNVFSSETTWPIRAKFYVEPPWEGGTKVCINGPGHMTKMAAMPIYGKNLKKSSSPEPVGRFPRNLVCSIGDWGLLPIIVCINDDPGVTLTYFTARSNLETLGFSIGKSENSGFFRN